MHPREDQHRSPAFAQCFAIDPAELDRSFQITRTFEGTCRAESRRRFWTGVVTGAGIIVVPAAIGTAVGPASWTLPLGVIAIFGGCVAFAAAIASEKRDAKHPSGKHQPADAVENQPDGRWTPRTSFLHLKDLPPAVHQGRNADEGVVDKLPNANQHQPDAEAERTAVTGSKSGTRKGDAGGDRGDVPPLTDNAERIFRHDNFPKSR